MAAVQHLNSEGDGNMLCRRPEGERHPRQEGRFVTGDIQTNRCRGSAKQMIEKDGAIMITGGSSSAGDRRPVTLPGDGHHLRPASPLE
jgi:hypothetical protein